MLMLSGFYFTQAQFVKGDKYLSGSFSGHMNDQDINDQDGVESYSINFAPSFYRFKTDKKATGFKILLGFNYSKQFTPSNTMRSRYGNIGAGLFSQNYFGLGKGFFMVIEKGVNGTFSLGSNDILSMPTSNSDFTAYSVNLYLTPGVGYKLTDRLLVGLNLNSILSIGYAHTVIKSSSSTVKNDALNISSGLNNTSVGNVGITFGWKIK